MKHLVLVIALAAFSTSAFAEGGLGQNTEELRLVKGLKVQVVDAVKDDCLANPNALKVEAELIVRRSEITVLQSRQTEVDPKRGLLTITATGAELTPTGCVVNLDVQLTRAINAPEGHIAVVEVYRRAELLYGYNKPQTQEALRSSVSEIVSDLANEILKARGN